MSETDKTSSASSAGRSFATISEEDCQPWDNLLGDSSNAVVPKIIRTVPSSTNVSGLDEVVCHNPQAKDEQLVVSNLIRSRSLNQARRSSSSSNGLLGSFHKQLRLSLRGVKSEPSSVKNAPSMRRENSLFMFRYRQAKFASRRVRKRVVFKHGDCNVVQWNVAKRRRRYLQDIFTTLVDAQWRWTLLVFALNFLLSWLGFALIWWLIIFTHGDLNPESQLNGTEPCVSNVQSFTGCFLFSVETQHTIGYGGRTTTEQCPEAIFVMCLQSIVGVFIQAFMVGIVFAKLSRPKKRAQTLLYSRNAVICLRDGQLCLMFRVGDMRKSHIVEAHIRAQVIRRKVTREGEVLPFYQQEMKVGADGEEDRLMFIWPMTIVHKINERSPLYNLSASDMLREKFEIVVMLEGVIESTGMTTQARSSYLPSEVFWGHRFESMVTFGKDTGEYEVDYMKFNNTYEVDTPLCSAKQLDELRATVSTSQKLDRLVGITKTFSNDTLQDLSSVESMSLDEHIEIKIPEARVRENRLLAQQQHDALFGHYTQNGHHSTSNFLMPPSESSANLTQVVIAPDLKPRLPNGSVHHNKELEQSKVHKEHAREHREQAREQREQAREQAREQREQAKEQVRVQGKTGSGGMRRSPSAQFKMTEAGTVESPPPPYPSPIHPTSTAHIAHPPPITVTAPETQPQLV